MPGFRMPNGTLAIAGAFSARDTDQGYQLMEENNRAVEDAINNSATSLNGAATSVSKTTPTSGTYYVSTNAHTHPGTSSGGGIFLLGFSSDATGLVAGNVITVGFSTDSAGASPTTSFSYTVTAEDITTGSGVSGTALVSVFVGGTSPGYLWVRYSGGGTGMTIGASVVSIKMT